MADRVGDAGRQRGVVDSAVGWGGVMGGNALCSGSGLLDCLECLGNGCRICQWEGYLLCPGCENCEDLYEDYNEDSYDADEAEGS